jgi:LPS-assembly protein
LLTPDLGYDSALGFIVAENYYWNIAPNQDATIGMMLTTQENPVGLVEYRRRWTQADLQANGSFTRSGRTDSVAGQDVALKDEWRGHLFADGRWDMSDTWRSGLKLELTSDDQYLRQYDFSSKDVLENEIYAERFSGRNYAAIRGLAFQDVRVREDQTDQPSVLPEAELRFVGTPNATLGGRWSVDASALGLVRDGSGQDVARGVLQAGWQRRATTSWGLVNTLDLSMRGDAYSVSDRDIATGATGRSSDGTQTRLFPQAQLVSSLPLVRPTARGQILVEPIAGLTVAPNINADDGDIPNEDSQDVQIDATNLFEASRFPGLDRIEDRSRVTYGLRTGIYGNQGNRLTAFLGQSHNLDSDDNPFPEGSGLERQDSDVVGSLSALYDEHFTANYRFQLSSDDLSSQRHEADIYAGWRRLGLGARYLFAKGLAGTNIDESREQAEGSVSYFLTEHWRTRVGALYDLGEDPGLRKAVMGVDFFGCCLSLSATAERNLTTDSSGDSGTDIMLRLGLKGLGEFEQVKTDRWGVLGSSRP